MLESESTEIDLLWYFVDIIRGALCIFGEAQQNISYGDT